MPVVAIAAFLERDLPPEEWECVRSMLGEVFEIYEIDEWGGAWVQYQSHSLSLESDEMELVEGQTQANANKRFNRTAKT